MRQNTPPGTPVGWKLGATVPADAVPMGGDGRYLYSPSRKEVLNWEACVESEILQPGTTPGPPPPAPPP